MQPRTSHEGPAKNDHVGTARPVRERLANSKWIVLASFVSLVTVYLTAHSYLQNQEELGRWGCRMSWMSPNYVRLAGPTGLGLQGLDRRYALWLYREGGLQPDLQPTGMPVLFIPGNSGSFKQVRSIASSAAHQFYGRDQLPGSAIGTVEDLESTKSWKELDFFAVDFNEEFSAFHPNTLDDQSLYVSHAIQHILGLYQPGIPASQRILLLAHSMGGIVARHAVTRLNTSSVSAIITMSTPHLIPPVTFERGMQAIYDEVDLFWNAASVSATSKSGVSNSLLPVLVSICGGTSDTQISSDSCALQPVTTHSGNAKAGSIDNGTFAVFTTGMEGVWTGVDHQAMVWCDQVRRIVATTLLDMSGTNHDHANVDPLHTRAQLANHARRRLLGERTAGELIGNKAESRTFMPLEATVITTENSSFGYDSPEPSVFVAKVPKNATRFQIIGNMRINGVGREGGANMAIYLGSSHHSSRAQYHALPLSILRILPKSQRQTNKVVQREMFPLEREGVNDEEVTTYAEAEFETSGHERQIILHLEGAAWGSVALLEEERQTPSSTSWKAIKQSHTFRHTVDNSLILHELLLRRPLKCSTFTSPLFSTIIEHVSHTGGVTRESRMYPQAESRLRLHTHTAAAPYIKPQGRDTPAASPNGLTINLWQDPNDVCGVQGVSLRVNWSRSLGLMVMRYRMTFLAWTTGLSALIMSMQFQRYRLTGVYPSFTEAGEMFSGQPLALLFLLLVGACLVQSSLLPMITASPEEYLLGLPLWYSALWVLPVLGISYALMIVCHLALRGLTSVLRLSFGWARTMRFSRSHQEQQHFKAQHAISMLALVILVKLLIPHQFAFIVASVVHLLSVASSGLPSHPHSIRSDHYQSLLLLLLLLLPAHGAVLFVWVRNLLVLIDKPPNAVHADVSTSSWLRGLTGLPESLFSSSEDHEVWHVFAILVIVEACSAGKTLDISSRYRPFCYATEASLLVFATVAFLIGGRYFYTVVEAVQVFMYIQAAWFVAPSLLAGIGYPASEG